MKKLLSVLLWAFSAAAFADQQDGTLLLLHSDDMSSGKSTHEWVLRGDGGKETVLDFSAGKEPHRGQVGHRFRVNGAPQKAAKKVHPGQHWKVNTLQQLGAATQAAPAAAPLAQVGGTVGALFILMNFNNSAAPWPQSQVQAVTQTAVKNVQAFYDEVSYGQFHMAITVTPWLTGNIAYPTSSCDFGAIAFAAQKAAQAAGYNLANYKYQFYVFPRVTVCAWNGLAYVGSPGAWSNGVNAGQLFTHELGHNLGLYHAGSVTAPGTASTVSEYGDQFSSMGSFYMSHYNAEQKSVLGWILTTVFPGGDVTYQLSPLEVPGGALYAVSVPTPSSLRTYWVEYRQPLGLFDTANGVQIRLSRPFEVSYGNDDTHIFPPFPGAGWYLPVGKTYYDAKYLISITALSADASGAAVQIVGNAAPPPPPPPPPPNNPPQIMVTVFPLAITTLPTSVGINAVTADTDGNVVRVEFFMNGVSFAVKTVAPWVASYNIAASGIYSFVGRATDNGGATTDSVAQVLTVGNPPPPPPADTTPPVTTIVGPADSTNTTATITFSGTDDVTPSGSLVFRGRLDGAAWGFVSSPVALSGLSVATHLYEVYATDAAGNAESPPKGVSWLTQPGPPPPPPPPPGTGTDTLWVDDALPAGGKVSGAAWSWITGSPANNPVPFCGGLMHDSPYYATVHGHLFYGATDRLALGQDDKLFQYVWIDPAQPAPREIILYVHQVSGNDAHRPYWGENLIAGSGLVYMGPIPQAQTWARLEAPAAAIGLNGANVDGVTYYLYGGHVTWDCTGKNTP